MVTLYPTISLSSLWLHYIPYIFFSLRRTLFLQFLFTAGDTIFPTFSFFHLFGEQLWFPTFSFCTLRRHYISLHFSFFHCVTLYSLHFFFHLRRYYLFFFVCGRNELLVFILLFEEHINSLPFLYIWILYSFFRFYWWLWRLGNTFTGKIRFFFRRFVFLSQWFNNRRFSFLNWLFFLHLVFAVSLLLFAASPASLRWFHLYFFLWLTCTLCGFTCIFLGLLQAGCCELVLIDT